MFLQVHMGERDVLCEQMGFAEEQTHSSHKCVSKAGGYLKRRIMLINFGLLKWEAWEIQPDAKRPHWATAMGTNFSIQN